MPEMTEAYEWKGRTIVGSDGEKLGKVNEIYLDGETNRPEWATITAGLFGNKSHFVPLAGASWDGEDVRAQVTKEQVSDAPSIDPDGQLSAEEETRLFEHYGVPYTQEGSVTAEGQPSGVQRQETDRSDEGRDTSGPTTDEMTRSEEDVHVGTRERQSGRVRLRKYVVIEDDVVAEDEVPVVGSVRTSKKASLQ